MKYLLLLTFFIIHKTSLSQTPTPSDSLKKYSYSILGFSTKGNLGVPSAGTCSFIRDRGNMFLLTAKHVLTGCDDNGIKPPFYPDIMNIMLHDFNCNPTTVIHLNIEKIKDSIPCLKQINDTDIVAVQLHIEDSVANKIFSIENFIMPPFEKIEKIVMYGFPSRVYSVPPANFGEWNADSFTMNGNETTIKVFYAPNTTNEIDSVNFYFYNDKEKIDTSLKGFSGSPIFIKDDITKKWRVAGVFASFTTTQIPTEKSIKMPRIDYATRYIYNYPN